MFRTRLMWLLTFIGPTQIFAQSTQTADSRLRTLYTTEFLGHTFSRPTLGRLHLSSPGLVGYLWPTPTSYTGHLIPFSLFTNADESDYVTT